MDSWIRILSTYFHTHPTIDETQKFQITILQLERLSQTWWDTQLDNQEIVVEIYISTEQRRPHIRTWKGLFLALKERFYPP